MEEVEATGAVFDPPWSEPGYRGAKVSSLDEPLQTASVLGVWTGIGALTVAWCAHLGPDLERALPTVMSWSRATWPVIGLTYVAAGAAHFALPQGFKDMFPHKGAWGWWNLPGSPEFHVAWTGVAEILGGLGMASGALWFVDTPDWLAPTSAYGLFLLTLAVTPANTYMFTHNAPGPLPEDADESMQVLPWYGHCARGALQVFLLATTWGVWTDRYEVDGAFGLVGDQLGADGFSLVITGVISGAIVLVALLLDDYLEREGMAGAEMYVLMLFSGAGGAVMASANDLIVLFLALETLSIAVYVMAAMHMRRSESQEAGLKYFVLGAFSSAFLLYGIALTYGAVGSTNLIVIADFLEQNRLIEDGLLMAGMAMLLVGLGFKVAAAPFHAWTPDVYQGAPTPVVAFMASAVKAAGFAALVRVFVTTFADHADDWQPAVYGLAILTLVVGSFMAIVQRDAKRMLAYSSISHAGFILVGVQAASDEGISSVLFYAVAYTFLVIGSFGVLSIVSGEGDRGTSLDHLDGLSTRRPALALALTVFLLAQAGVPLTSGFVAKFAVIGAAVEARSYWLAIAAMVTAVVSAFLYLRIILSMYLGQAEDDAPTIRVPRAAGLAIIVALVITVGFGLVPGELDDITRDAVPVLIAAG